MSKRIAYGTLAILAILTLCSVDAEIARWAVGRTEHPPGAAVPRLPIPLANLFQHGSVLPLLLLVVVLYAASEFMRLLRAKGAAPHRVFVYAMAAAVFLSPWLSASGWLGDDVAGVEGLFWPIVLLAGTVLGAGILQVFTRATDGSMRDVGATVLTVLYVGFLPSFALQLRSGSDSPAEQGVWLLLITLLVTKASDIGAYFVGSFLGRHKLAPHISPGKSVEGAIGGVIGSVAAAMLIVAMLPTVARLLPGSPVVMILDEITGVFGRELDGASGQWLRPILFGAMLSFFAQCGDLFESCFKRDASIKDSGSVLPQFGGILDLIDSPLFAVPVAWFLLTRVWHVI